MIKDTQYWERLQALFHLAEDTPEPELDAVLAAHCDDAGMRRDARELILAARGAAHGSVHGAGDAPVPVAAALPKRIGPYTVLRPLGAGGMGAVYLVERLAGGSVQRCALKVLAQHAAGPFFADRFAREQHILASLDHPHITRMLDAGMSESGQPYLVMEYVDGVHLDVYCDRRKLGIPARLGLFASICEAVAYAHRNLVVHLDLKPSNILVASGAGTETGSVKLLDFGTSKLIDPDMSLTTTLLATPAYASPEQLRNDPVTTSCDIYALGAILFELLCGRRPNHDSSVGVMIERAIRELPPESLSEAATATAAADRGLTETRLHSLLKSDLATIASKCLNPRPQDRYASVDALLVDVARYREGRPILARPQTTTYRIGKFVRRNAKGVAATTLATAALAASLGLAAWRQHQAVVEGQRALEMQTFMTELFKIANTNYLGKPAATVPELLRMGVRVLPELIHDPAARRAARLSMAESMYDNDDDKEAEKNFLEVIDEAKAANDVNAQAEATSFAAYIGVNEGRIKATDPLVNDCLELSRRRGLSAENHLRSLMLYVSLREIAGFRDDGDLQLLRDAVAGARRLHLPDRLTANAFLVLASTEFNRGNADEAARLAREALQVYDRAPYPVCERSEVYAILGQVSYSHDQYEAALLSLRKGYEGYLACSGPANENTLGAQLRMIPSLLKLNRPQDVVDLIQPNLPLYRKVLGDGPGMGEPYLFLARANMRLHRYAEAEEESVECARFEDGKVAANTSRVAICHFAWAQALAAEGKDAQAMQQVRIANEDYAGIRHMSPGEQANADGSKALQVELGRRMGR